MNFSPNPHERALHEHGGLFYMCFSPLEIFAHEMPKVSLILERPHEVARKFLEIFAPTESQAKTLQFMFLYRMLLPHAH